MQIAHMAESSLRTCFSEASVEDMLPMAYGDACTAKFCFCKLFLAVPFFVCGETSEKDLMERLFLCKMVVLQERYLALGRWFACCFALLASASLHQATDVAKANNQMGLLLALRSRRGRQEIALGVYGLTGSTPPRVALQGP
jgi:hypothetical protein